MRRPLALLAALFMLTSCVLVVHPEAGGDHCAPSNAATDCLSCLASRCQEAVDACCFPGTCSDLLSVFERCSATHDSSCTDARARTSAANADEARFALCAATRCSAVCGVRTGTSTTQCRESHTGEATCGCSVAQPANDVECAEANGPSRVCCASRGWPGPSLACTCAPVVCVPSGTGCFCSVNEYAPPGYESTCGGVGLSCCAFNGTCRCGTSACEAPEVAVDTCSITNVSCDEARQHVASCSLRTN